MLLDWCAALRCTRYSKSDRSQRQLVSGKTEGLRPIDQETCFPHHRHETCDKQQRRENAVSSTSARWQHCLVKAEAAVSRENSLAFDGSACLSRILTILFCHHLSCPASLSVFQLNMSEQEDSEYLVDQIYAERKKKNSFEYKVRWQGFSADDDTWETEENLAQVKNGLDKLQEYKDSLKKKSKKELVKSESDRKARKSSPAPKTTAKAKSSKSQSSKSSKKSRDESSPSPPTSPVIPTPSKKTRPEEATDKPDSQVSTPKKPKVEVDPFALAGAAKSVFLTPTPKQITKKPEIEETNGDKTDEKLSVSKETLLSTSNGTSKDSQPLESAETNGDQPADETPEPKPTKVCGFDKGYQAESIEQATKIGGRIFLKIHWKDDVAEDELVPSDIARYKCPQLLIQFYQKRLFWSQKKDSSD